MGKTANKPSDEGILDQVDLDKKENGKMNIDDYFKSEEHKLIFALVYTDTYLRADLLGITEELYTDKKLAKAWRNSIISKIHPDVCNIPGAKEAVEKLNAFYERMKTDDGDVDE